MYWHDGTLYRSTRLPTNGDLLICWVAVLILIGVMMWGFVSCIVATDKARDAERLERVMRDAPGLSQFYTFKGVTCFDGLNYCEQPDRRFDHVYQVKKH